VRVGFVAVPRSFDPLRPDERNNDDAVRLFVAADEIKAPLPC
jgi:hypothetical protein